MTSGGLASSRALICCSPPNMSHVPRCASKISPPAEVYLCIRACARLKGELVDPITSFISYDGSYKSSIICIQDYASLAQCSISQYIDRYPCLLPAAC
eukprot:1927500-Pleurochrysis_carterae.AAC.1